MRLPKRWRRSLFAALLSVAVVATAGVGQTLTTEVDMQRADGHYRKGRFTEAEAEYLRVLQSEPQNATVLERLGTLALWRNQPDQAVQYLTRALASASWWRRLWPFNIELKSRLGLAHYRADRFADAARAFDEAAGPIAVGGMRNLRAYSRALALFDGVTPYAIDGPDQTEVTFVMTDPLPVIEVSVNGLAPVAFFIDTGGAEVILDRTYAQQAGAHYAGYVTDAEGAGPKGNLGLGKIDTLRIGAFTLRAVPIHMLDTQPLTAVFNRDVQGVIGTRLLMRFLATLDYPRAALVLRRPMPEQRQQVEDNAKTNAGKFIPFWLVDTHVMVTWGRLNQLEPMLFFVDTGLAGRGFTAPEATLRAAGVAIDWSQAREGPGAFGKAEGVDIVLERVTLGSGDNEVVAQQLPGMAIKQLPSILHGQFGFPIGGLISHEFFKPYALTFDFAAMQMILQ